MIVFRILAVLLTLCLPASAQWGDNAVITTLNPQVLPANASAGLPAVDDNYAGGGYPITLGVCSEFGHQVPCYNHTAITRASVKYCASLDGIWSQVSSGQMCWTNQGVLIEEARTNNALRARDMTQAAWVTVGMGTALNAVGIDGTANSASTLTATGTASSCTASCTILQTLTIGSAAENYSVWLKRVTGSGAVNITINNLVGTTACTLTTTAFTRCTVTATLANPVIGIQMAALNDVIIADFNQLEAGAFPTSPILTITVAATRAADVVSLANSPFLLLNNSIGTTMLTSNQISNITNGNILLGDGTSSWMATTTTSSVGRSRANAVNLSYTFGSGNYSSRVKAANGWSSAGRSVVGNFGTVATDVNIYAGTAGYLGSNNGATQPDGYYERLMFFGAIRFPDATLKAMTQ